MFSRVGFWFGFGFNVKLERLSDTWTVFSFITCWLIDSDCGRFSVLESRQAGELLPICSAQKRLQGGLPSLRHHHWLTTVFNTFCVVCIYVSHSSSNHNNIYILFLLNVDNLTCDSALMQPGPVLILNVLDPFISVDSYWNQLIIHKCIFYFSNFLQWKFNSTSKLWIKLLTTVCSFIVCSTVSASL